MKLASVALENVKSFRDRTKLSLEQDMNILVGPSGGGKSNLLDTITVAVRRDVLPPFRISDRGRGKLQIQPAAHFQRLTQVLPKCSGNEDSPQSIELEILFEKSDCNNIRTIRHNLPRFQDILHRFRNPNSFPLSQTKDWDPDAFEPGTRVRVDITEGRPKWQGDEPQLSKWKQYASYLELYPLLLHETGGPRLHPAFLYFSPFRGSASESHFQADLSSTGFSQVLASYFGSMSTSQTSVIQSASLYFAEKHRLLEGRAVDVVSWPRSPSVPSG